MTTAFEECPAADYQIDYDQAVHAYGPHSTQARNAERAARNFFKDPSCKSVKLNAAKQNFVLASLPPVEQEKLTLPF